MDASLSNLIIPFKDNNGARLKLYQHEADRFREQLEDRASELIADLTTLLGENCELTISPRSDGFTKKYFWRFRSSKRDRKYVRLHAESLREFLSGLHHNQIMSLKQIEEELIYINANFRLLKGISDSIEQSVAELAELRSSSL